MFLLFVASFAYAVGGIFMKYAAGMTRLGPTLLFCLLFVAGACLQSLAMRANEMGVTYIVVLGLEAVLAFLFSVIIFQESASASRLFAVALITVGIVLLRAE